MSKPIAFVKNVSGPHHHHGGLQTPLGCTVPVFSAQDLSMVQNHSGYEIIPVEKLALEKGAVEVVEAPPETPPSITLENLRAVKIHGVAEDPPATRVKLVDGSVVLVKDILLFLQAQGHAAFSGGWITLYPDTDGQLKCQGYEKLAQEIRLDPGLFYPPDADAAPPETPAEDAEG
jgi:hypothetical protein